MAFVTVVMVTVVGRLYLAADFCGMGGFDQVLFLSRWDEDCEDHEDFEDIGGTTTRPNG